ncbi:MAG: nitroreductase family protein [Victivallales bacterium]|nr:nitroreductase family protein [Victivallales bacterium]
MMEMNSLDRIFARRSVRSYSPKVIPEETVVEILSAAMSAPTACDKKTPEFIVLTEKEALATVASFLPNGGFLAVAPLGIVVCGDMNRAHAGELSYMLQDCSAAIQNILLAVSMLGLGACWLGVHPRADRVENITNYLSLPRHVVPVSVISIGFPAAQPEPRKRFFKEHVHFNKW